MGLASPQSVIPYVLVHMTFKKNLMYKHGVSVSKNSSSLVEILIIDRNRKQLQLPVHLPVPVNSYKYFILATVCPP